MRLRVPRGPAFGRKLLRLNPCACGCPTRGVSAPDDQPKCWACLAAEKFLAPPPARSKLK